MFLISIMNFFLQGFKVDVTNKQLTVDFVNAAMAQQTADGDAPDKMEIAEKLGQMNNNYQAISSDIMDKLKNLELQQVSILLNI